jgi:hypothetical protein
MGRVLNGLLYALMIGAAIAGAWWPGFAVFASIRVGRYVWARVRTGLLA